ncbi:MAG TPA: hypothetical protein PKA37_09870, partial [Planctomycetota bacterium]|nr:hypothetical protein [Planctomycetota bacterium]
MRPAHQTTLTLVQLLSARCSRVPAFASRREISLLLLLCTLLAGCHRGGGGGGSSSLPLHVGDGPV